VEKQGEWVKFRIQIGTKSTGCGEAWVNRSRIPMAAEFGRYAEIGAALMKLHI
jgi:hypothetical protein